jgi:ProP effector
MAPPLRQHPLLAQSLPQPDAPSVSTPPAQTTDAPPPAGLPSRKQRDAQARSELLMLLQERWPQRFPRDMRQVKPFALGIHQAILTELPTVKPYLLRQTIRFYQQGGKGAYWRAILHGGSRYRLDGTPEGEVTVEDQAHAREALAAVEAWWQAKRAARRAQARAEQPPSHPLPTSEAS